MLKDLCLIFQSFKSQFSKRGLIEIEEGLDAMHKLKSSACALRDDQEKNRKIHLINDSIARLGK